MSRPAKTLSIVLCRTAAFCAIAICAAFAQNKNFGDKSLHSDEKNAILISVVESSEKLHESLQGKPSLQFGSSRASAPAISAADSQFQQIDGFGGSLTDSSAWLLEKKLMAPPAPGNAFRSQEGNRAECPSPADGLERFRVRGLQLR
jgi:hypothetical protein